MPPTVPSTPSFRQTMATSTTAGAGLLRNMKERPLSVYEKKFLLCAERGDVVSVKKLLQDHCKPGLEKSTKLNINCTDPLGRTALILAVENENMELMEVLMKYGIDPGDALLHAISEEYVEAVEVLLQHEERIHKPGNSYSWEKVDHDTSAYTRDITPLILAAHKDNYEILKILLDRGAELPLPHDVKCSCYDCITSITNDCLRHSRSRINAYHALCSPSLISLSSRDPILTAFQLSWELRRLSKIEKEFALDYRQLRTSVQNFAVALLDHVRNTHELRVILNYTSDKYVEDEEMKLERLKLAIDYKQKSFVAHPNVQQLLGSVWFEGMPGYRRKGPVKQVLQVAGIAFRFPLYSLAVLLLPNSKLAQIARRPFIKFISHSASYLFFLLLLVLASQRVEFLLVSQFEDYWVVQWLRESYFRERGRLPNITEWAVIVYIISFIWQETAEFYNIGVFNYFSDLWNVVDFLANIVYINWIGLRVLSFLQVHIEQQEMADLEEIPKQREDWDAYDPMLLSEGMFGAANIFSFLKLIHIFSVHPHLGPLQISLGRMVFDILKFFSIFVLVLFAFGCGMNQLLWYYAEKELQRCKFGGQRSLHPLEVDHACEVWRRFANLFETSQTLFWASFGLIDLYNFELAGIKEFTRFWGLLMFGAYSVINVVVLLNLLIAMMSNSYNAISEKSDTEWKFARSKLWISYFDETLAVAAPFNLLPPIGRLFCEKKKLKRFPSTSSGSIGKETYSNVMRCLVRRYVTREQRKAEETGLVTEDDVNEIKQDIGSFRYELIDMLKKNGMKYESKLSHDDCFGKRERTRERRLLKGFNIGLIEKTSDIAEDRISEHESPGIVQLITNRSSFRRRQLARKRWTAAVNSILAERNADPIGVTRRRHSSLKNLREEVFRERESTVEEYFDDEFGGLEEILTPSDSLDLPKVKEILRVTPKIPSITVDSQQTSSDKKDVDILPSKSSGDTKNTPPVDPAGWF
ncbi:transient receptor potential-gamma protein-like isoform X2 [Brevipalpus obovatus]|uniref:transient receptor potential-gamma protein-like isoform X2 n=1 Tax=Brevipalpus obovatus TaxID=246614 RepID=UPI003D9E1FC1